MLLMFSSQCFGSASFENVNPYVVGQGETAVITCKTDSPWIWMDKLVNITRNNAPTRFLQIASRLVRFDELVTRDARITLDSTAIPQSRKHFWTLQISNVSKLDEGYVSCVEQIYLPDFTQLSRDSVAYLKLGVM